MTALLNNMMFQMFTIVGGILALKFLWENRPGDDTHDDERGDRLA